MSLRSVFVLATVAVAAAGAFTPAAQARVWIVRGPGADYSYIQPAIDAAADGDVVLIRTGGYPEVTIDNKALTLVAEPGQDVWTPEIRIANLTTGKTVVVGGLRAALWAEDNMGSVRIEGMTLYSAILTNDAPVAFRGCSVLGGVVARASNVALYDCQLTGGAGEGAGPGGSPGPGGNGLESDAFVFASGSRFVGGAGGEAAGGPPPQWPGGPGGSGIVLLAGSSGVPSAQLLDCVALGGVGGDGSPDGIPGQPIIAPPGTVAQLPGTSRHMDAVITAGDRTVVTLTFRGNSGDQVTLLSSPAPGFRFSSQDRGVFLVGEPPAQQISMGTIPESGELAAQLSLDDLAGANAVLCVQARMDSAGQVTLGSQASLVRWATLPNQDVHFAWRSLTVTRPPASFYDMTMAYDSARDRMVFYGDSQQLWEWDGMRWDLRASDGPQGRFRAVYDAARRVTLLFGEGQGQAETWEWDGSSFALRSTTGPPLRSFHAMAYDAARGVTVLFGGVGSEGRFGDTWEWNGTIWTLRANSGPAPRFYHAMAYDPVRRVTVLCGGEPGVISDTWEWDGYTWALRSSSGVVWYLDSVMAYHGGLGATVLFGSEGYPYQYGARGETWQWNGNLWEITYTPVHPPHSRAQAMAYDSARDEIVLLQGDPYGDLTHTWIFGPNSTVSVGDGHAPALARMLKASPNPSSGPTQIEFQLPERGSVEFQIFDPLGRRVDGIPARVWEAGAGRVEWSGTTSAGARLSSGLYFVRMLVDGRSMAATKVLRIR